MVDSRSNSDPTIHRKTDHVDPLTTSSFPLDRVANDSGSQAIETVTIVRNMNNGLDNLPEDVLILVLSRLDPYDVARNVCSVNRRLATVCNSERIWQAIFQRNKELISPYIRNLADTNGFKRAYRQFCTLRLINSIITYVTNGDIDIGKYRRMRTQTTSGTTRI